VTIFYSFTWPDRSRQKLLTTSPTWHTMYL